MWPVTISVVPPSTPMPTTGSLAPPNCQMVASDSTSVSPLHSEMSWTQVLVPARLFRAPDRVPPAACLGSTWMPSKPGPLRVKSSVGTVKPSSVALTFWSKLRGRFWSTRWASVRNSSRSVPDRLGKLPTTVSLVP